MKTSRLIELVFAGVLTLALVACSSENGTADYAAGVDEVQDLAGKKVAVLSGSLQDLAISDMAPAPDVFRLASAAEVLMAVENGKADYCLIDVSSVIGSHLDERGMQQVFVSEMASGPYGFGLNRSNTSLHAELNEFLKDVRENGELERITDKWTKGDVESVVMPDIEMNPDGEVIRVGTAPYFPFSFIQEGKNAGLEVEILERFAARTGRNLHFDIIDFSGLIAALASDKTDLIASAMTITEERSKQVLFSDPYYDCFSVCIARVPGFQVEKKSFTTKIKESFANNLIVENRWKLVLQGLYETLVISIFSIIFGALFGALICWMRMSRNGILKKTAVVYVDIIRGIPILVLLMVMFYVVFTSGSVSPTWVAIIAFSMNFGAYVSEMYRTGIEGIDKGQTEAGLAMGFTPLKTFVYFIVPQAAKKVIPVFKGEAVSLIKNTSVVGFIAIQDLTKASEIIRSRTFDAFFPLIIISVIYFLLAWLLGKLIDSLANKIA